MHGYETGWQLRRERKSGHIHHVGADGKENQHTVRWAYGIALEQFDHCKTA